MPETLIYTIYTDGACQPNPGPGGWGAVIIAPDQTIAELSGSAAQTTNNRMELTAAIQAILHFKAPADMAIHSDSRYLQQGITQWLPAWEKRGWQTSVDTEVKNLDLWQRLAELTHHHSIDWFWVKGHADNEWNERADELARAAVYRPPLPLDDQEAIHIFTGISVKGTKRGSWCAILRYRNTVKPLYGTVPDTTGNRMHIHSALAGLAALRKKIPIHIYTFSGYLKDGACQWTSLWRQNDWYTREGNPVSHQDLWQQLDAFNSRYTILWHLADKQNPPCEMQAAKILAQEIIQEETA